MLWVLWKFGGGFGLDGTSAVMVVDGERESVIREAWGAAPVDARPPTTQLLRLFSKPYVDGASPDLTWLGVFGDDKLRRPWEAEKPRTSLQFIFL